MPQVKEFRAIESLAELRRAWDSLLKQTIGASFFQSLDWLECYWRHYGLGQELRVLHVHDRGNSLGIVPLVVRAEPTRAGRIRALTYPLDDWGTFYGPIGPQPEVALSAALKHLRATRRSWDMLDLRWVHPHLDQGLAARSLKSAGFQAYPQVTAQAGLIDLHGGWDKYWAKRSSHWRNNVRRAERRVAEAGEVTHVHYRPRGDADGEGDPRWDLYEECEAIAAASWQASSTTGTTLSHAAIRAFLRDMHPVAARCGALDLHLLRVGGRPAAFAYNYCYQGYVFGLRTGYDASVSRDGLGTVIMQRVIETCFRQTDHTLDLGINYLDCKRNWLTSIMPVYRYTHFRPAAPKAQLLRLKRVAQNWLGRRGPETTPPPKGERPASAG
jgi:CelD/BcsL family acetyltransferase involved in cellulose biosynthesis